MIREVLTTGDSTVLDSLSIIMREKCLQEYGDMMQREGITEDDLLKLLFRELVQKRDRDN